MTLVPEQHVALIVKVLYRVECASRQVAASYGCDDRRTLRLSNKYLGVPLIARESKRRVIDTHGAAMRGDSFGEVRIADLAAFVVTHCCQIEPVTAARDA